MSSGPPKIAIIGSGIAGLTLACVLHRGGIPYTVYEAEVSLTSRKQGGPVNVHYDRGEKVLRALGLFDIYEKSMYTAGCEANTFGDKNGKLYIHHSFDDEGTFYPEGEAPLVDRIEIRRLLLSAIPAESVLWNCKIQDILPRLDNTFDLTFADGSSENGFDLVVGADGAWSKARPLVSQARPYYAGQCYLETEIQNISAAPPAVLDLMKRGSYYFPDTSTTLVAQRDGNRSIWIYAFVHNIPETWVKEPGFDLKDIPTAKKIFLDRYWSGWSEELRAVIVNSDTDLTPRALYMLPVGHKWEHRAGITLIGDAAHLMTPWGGMGGNLAMEDGYELGEAILIQGRMRHWSKGAKFVNHRALDAAVKGFETAMFPRAEKEADRTQSNLELFRSEGAAQTILDLVKMTSL
jgi:2-polyprenyl-6-methoxyphenol hydroxylase-like FAD-dependent oxidoreductase